MELIDETLARPSAEPTGQAPGDRERAGSPSGATPAIDGGRLADIAGDDTDPEVARVADNMVTLLRSFGQARSRMLARAAHDVEWSANVMLKSLESGGAMRAAGLAECLNSDPSTVSRQVAALVKDGLVERQADPGDGRASLLALTAKGRAVLAEHDRIRLTWFAGLLADWSPDDLERFGDLLSRFTATFNEMNHDWVADQISRSTIASRGNA